MHAITENRNLIRRAPVERVREELNDILLSDTPSTYRKVIHKTRLLSIVLPELDRCAGVRQDRKYHKFDVFKHCLYTCDYIEPDLILRLSAVLHDIGKPDTREVHGDRTTFHKHEVISARLTKTVLERLRYKKEIISKVIHLIRLHMYHYTRDFTDAAVLRFIKKAGIVKEDLNNIENFPLFKLRKAERKGNGFKTIPVTERQHDFEKRIQRVFKGSKGFNIEDLDINGHVIMELFNMKPGKKVGETLSYLLEKVLDEPKLNNRKELIRLAAEYIYYKM
jgi:poly(A) polymerase/tRNA nucleotidyltransferase (CCA-adding enzyme)